MHPYPEPPPLPGEHDPLDEPPPIPPRHRRRPPIWRRGPLGCLLTGVIAVVILALLLGLGLGVAMEMGYLPDSAAVPGAELEARVVQFLVEHDIIEANENVLYFYADGFLSFAEDGNLFTDRRAIAYWQEDGDEEIQVYWAAWSDITAIEPTWSQSWLEPSLIDVHERDESSFTLIVSTEDGGDRDFYRLLRKTWEKRR